MKQCSAVFRYNGLRGRRRALIDWMLRGRYDFPAIFFDHLLRWWV